MAQLASYLRYKVRAGQRTDAKAVFEIFHDALVEHGFTYPRESVKQAWHIVDFGAGVDPDRDEFVAVSAGRVCGFLVMFKQTSGCAELAKMFVARSHRGRGAGEALHDACLLRARERGYRKLVLVTEVQFEAARRWYERHGWQRAPDMPIAGRDERHYSLDLTRLRLPSGVRPIGQR